MAQGQLFSMEQTSQPMQWMLKGFFQSPDKAHGVSRGHIYASHPTTFIFCVFAFSSFRLATNDSVMSLLEPDCGVVWLKYEEPGSATMLMCSSVRVFLHVVLVIDVENLCQSLILSTIKEYYLYARVVKLVTIQLVFLTIFPAFSADLASIDYFIPVDRRYETKIMQN